MELHLEGPRQGNLFWLGESPDTLAGTSGEPPRMGYRYYRVSPDYTTLELYIAPDRAVQLRAHSQGRKLDTTPRVVRIDLTSGKFPDEQLKLTDPNKIPTRPFVGDFTKRGEAMKAFRASLDPVRVAGTLNTAPK